MGSSAPWSLGWLAERFALSTSHPERTVSRLARLSESARFDPGGSTLTGCLVLAADSEQAARAFQAGAAAVLGPSGLEGPALGTPDPEAAYEVLARELTQVGGAAVSPEARLGPGVEVGPCAVVEAGAEVGPGCRIESGACLGLGVRLGRDCRIGPGAVLMAGVRLGDRVEVGPNAVVGSDGYGYVLDEGRHAKVPQVGTVDVGDDTRIGACVCIDRATSNLTSVGREVVLGPLSQVGHNVRIGDRSRIGPQVGLPGSCTIEEDCQLGYQSAVIGHSVLGRGSRLAPRSGQTRRQVPPGSDLAGFPARPRREFARIQAAVNRLPHLLDALESSPSAESP